MLPDALTIKLVRLSLDQWDRLRFARGTVARTDMIRVILSELGLPPDAKLELAEYSVRGSSPNEEGALVRISYIPSTTTDTRESAPTEGN